MMLPIEPVLDDVVAALGSRNGLVLVAPPGAGKTTRVPLTALEADWLQGDRIVMLEPRRLAARAASRYMARLLGEDVGERVGYRTRLDTRIGPETRIEVVTEGVLTRMLQSDPALDGVGLVIFDEFHERSLHADLGLALCLHVRELIRPELRLLIMSATLDPSPVAELLGGAPVIQSEGRAYGVETRYRQRPHGRIEELVASTIRDALDEDPGDVLVFLPGAAEIRRVQERLVGSAKVADGRHLMPDGPSSLPGDVDVYPLYGNLPREAQDGAIAPSLPGRRKVVLATAIAETSLTIEGVRIVVDSGLMRVARFSPRTGMTRLDTVPVTRDAADQRRGRAGRTEAGVCYRLWTREEEHGLVERRAPEIREADLAPLALELAAWGVEDPAELRWLDPPSPAAFAQARELLHELGAIGPGGITEHGRALSALPAHPRIGHMLTQARRLGTLPVACDLAALLGERDILKAESPDPDIGLRLDVLERGRTGRVDRTFAGSVIDRGALRRVLAEARTWRRRLRVPERSGCQPADAGLLLAFAYPDRIGKRRADRGSFLLRNGRGAAIETHHPLAGEEFIVAAELAGHGRVSRVWRAADLSAADLREHFSDQVTVHEDVAWDSGSRTVRTRGIERLGAIELRSSYLPDADPAVVTGALIAGVRQEGVAALPWSEKATEIRKRVAFLRTLEPAAWPDPGDDALAATLDAWLAPWLHDHGSFADLASLDWVAVLEHWLGHERVRELAQAAPTHCTVPSGSRIRIDYSDPDAPALAVRLQEIFGLLETPRTGYDRVPLTMRLLSPARRPVQVTRDLASFWLTGYFEVRKDLRARYPKHAWPEDPLTAAPTRGVRRR